MGPIGNLLGMLPGAAQMKDALAEVDDKPNSIVSLPSMRHDAAEDGRPKIINASRRLRIANLAQASLSGSTSWISASSEARKMMSSMLGAWATGHRAQKSATRKSKGAEQIRQEE